MWSISSDDPYYCGLRARIPNFAKSKAQKEKEAKYGRIGERRDKEGHPMVWHGPQRGYLENGEHHRDFTIGLIFFSQG